MRTNEPRVCSHVPTSLEKTQQQYWLAPDSIDTTSCDGVKVNPNPSDLPRFSQYLTEVFQMDANRPEAAKSGRTFDSAYSFSFSIAVGLILFIAGLVISLTLDKVRASD
jgi:hypothetical protein